MQDITTIGIDLAKEVFAVCVLDVTGVVVYSKVLKRDAFMAWAEQLSPRSVAMDGRVGYHKTLVAIANKHARMIWAMLAKDEGWPA